MFIQTTRPLIRAAFCVVLLVGALTLGGCTAPRPSSTAGVSTEPVTPARPAEPDLATPEDAVRSYLDWTSFGYAMANSEIATMTMTPDEEVRVNSYVQLNKERNRTIDQKLTAFEWRGKPSGEHTVTLGAIEQWRYRYVSIDKREPGPYATASYVTTYTVVKTDGDWLVDSVEASATTAVK